MDTALTFRTHLAGEATDDLARQRLGELFESHNQRLFLLGLRLTGDREQALDLVQETFLRAARRIGAIPEPSAAARAWLVRVLVNLVRDRWRRRAARATARQRRPTTSPGTETEAELRLAVQQALATLAPRRRAIVVLSEIEGRTSREIGETLKMSDVTVRWHLAAARKRLRRLLEPDLQGSHEAPD